MKPRIAVLGCGYWGSNHIRTLKALGALHAVSDVNRARAEGFASEQECLAIEPDKLFDRADIDAIVMALPPQYHADTAVRAVESGKDVLVEKPIALTVADAERAVKAAKDNGRVFMVGHVLRFHPAFEMLKALIDNGELGEVRYIHSHRLGLGKFHTENDALWDLAPHDLSMILAITGTEPVEVRVAAQSVSRAAVDRGRHQGDGGVRRCRAVGAQACRLPPRGLARQRPMGLH